MNCLGDQHNRPVFPEKTLQTSSLADLEYCQRFSVSQAWGCSGQ
jgi:hypothetical protein